MIPILFDITAVRPLGVPLCHGRSSIIDVTSFATNPGLYEVARWTGTATGMSALGNMPAGLSYELVYKLAAKTLHVRLNSVPGGSVKIISVHYDEATHTTTINYISQPGISHTVKGTGDFTTWETLSSTAVGTGAVLQYVRSNAAATAKYFYIFETAS